VTSRLLCSLGLHHDGTDAFGGYSRECLRCGEDTASGMTSTARGVIMSVFAVGMIFLGLADTGSAAVALVLGGVLFVLGLVMIWRQWP